jgi:CBS domain-containing protein
MSVAALLDTKPGDHLSLAPDDSVAAAVSLFNAEKRGLIMVADRTNKLLGVVSVADVIRALGQHGNRTLELPLSEIMTTDILVCDVDEDLESVLRKMNQRHVRHMPVIERGQLKGVIDTRDVLTTLLDDMRMNMDQLRNYFLKMGGRY